jgi:hypothetical protein
MRRALATSPELSIGNRITLGIFGIVCFLMGIGWLVSIVKDDLYGHWRTRAGVTAQATLRSVETHTSSHGRGGSTTSTVVRYDYEVGGQSFAGKRIALFKETRDFFQPLSAAFRSGSTIPVFIDPQHPQFAVIDREFSWWPILVAVPFSFAFVICGFWVLRVLHRDALQRKAPRLTVLMTDQRRY